MNTERFERACCCPMNSRSRCGRSEPSVASSSRRSAITSRREVGFKEAPSQRALAAIFVGQQLADAADGGAVDAGYDHASVAIVTPDQLAAAPAWRHYDDSLMGFVGVWMTHRHDRLDSSLTHVGHRSAEGHRFRADRHAAQIRIEIDPGINASIACAQGSADLLPVVAITALYRLAGGGDQLLVALAEHRITLTCVISRVPSIRAELAARHRLPRPRCA